MQVRHLYGVPGSRIKLEQIKKHDYDWTRVLPVLITGGMGPGNDCSTRRRSGERSGYERDKQTTTRSDRDETPGQSSGPQHNRERIGRRDKREHGIRGPTLGGHMT